MQIRVIKKGKITNQEKETVHLHKQKPETKPERKVERKILDWISDLREKKNLEFAQTQVLLSSLR